MKDIAQATIHIFYDAEHQNGYTVANSNREACQVAHELMKRTGITTSVSGLAKHWRTGKYSSWIIELSAPFKDNMSRGEYVIPKVIL